MSEYGGCDVKVTMTFHSHDNSGILIAESCSFQFLPRWVLTTEPWQLSAPGLMSLAACIQQSLLYAQPWWWHVPQSPWIPERANWSAITAAEAAPPLSCPSCCRDTARLLLDSATHGYWRCHCHHHEAPVHSISDEKSLPFLLNRLWSHGASTCMRGPHYIVPGSPINKHLVPLLPQKAGDAWHNGHISCLSHTATANHAVRQYPWHMPSQLG